MEQSYEEICKAIGHLYLDMFRQLNTVQSHLSKFSLKAESLEAENQQLRDHLARLAHDEQQNNK